MIACHPRVSQPLRRTESVAYQSSRTVRRMRLPRRAGRAQRLQDVAVTDGFTGNVFLKATEAVAKLLIEKIRETIKGGNFPTKVGGALVRPALGSIRKMLDPSEEGAAPLLGVNGLVFIGHGRSDQNAIKNAIRVARDAVESGLLDAMGTNIRERLKTL